MSYTKEKFDELVEMLFGGESEKEVEEREKRERKEEERSNKKFKQQMILNIRKYEEKEYLRKLHGHEFWFEKYYGGEWHQEYYGIEHQIGANEIGFEIAWKKFNDFFKIRNDFIKNYPEMYESKKKVSAYTRGKLSWIEVPYELAMRYRKQSIIRKIAKHLQEELDGIGQTGNTGRNGSSRSIRSPEKTKPKS